MAAPPLNEQDWQIRHFVYTHFVQNGTPPDAATTARHFDMSEAAARQAYQRLHDAHMLFLEPESNRVRIANPLSAVPTAYRVYVQDGSQPLWANCAWDSLGIPAMLHSDARIEARLPLSDMPVRYAIEQGQLVAPEPFLVHFPLPFQNWYDDLIHT